MQLKNIFPNFHLRMRRPKRNWSDRPHATCLQTMSLLLVEKTQPRKMMTKTPAAEINLCLSFFVSIMRKVEMAARTKVLSNHRPLVVWTNVISFVGTNNRTFRPGMSLLRTWK